jgi:hypothetical protein
MKEVTAKSYTLTDDNGNWLGQVLLSSDGMFASVTDYGNLSYAWRAYGDKDFRQFIAGLSADYFGSKLYSGMTYIAYSKGHERACNRFAVMILPVLQKVLKAELEAERAAQLTHENQ